MSQWIRIEDELPPEGVEVTVITPVGNVRQLVFHRGLFFVPDLSMYVYFTPTHWMKK